MRTGVMLLPSASVCEGRSTVTKRRQVSARSEINCARIPVRTAGAVTKQKRAFTLLLRLTPHFRRPWGDYKY